MIGSCSIRGTHRRRPAGRRDDQPHPVEVARLERPLHALGYIDVTHLRSAFRCHDRDDGTLLGVGARFSGAIRPEPTTRTGRPATRSPPARDRQRSDELDGNSVGVGGERFDIGSVTAEDCPAGFGESDDESVDS